MLSLQKDIDHLNYPFQRAYVSAMMKLIARLFQAGSEVDEDIMYEVDALPEGYIFRMEASPGNPSFMLQKKNNVMCVIPDDTPVKPTLVIRFKHISHAFLVFSFQEGTARAFANDRLLIDGNPSMAMKVVRCLNRVQAVVLPKLIAQRAIKTYPNMSWLSKLQVSAKTYRKLVINLTREF